jgi:thioester reductase-like protein
VCGQLIGALGDTAVHGYQRLRPANVMGTLEVLRLCCQGRAKRLEHISTISVLDGYPAPLVESIDLDLDTDRLSYLTPYR